ncbi:MAG: phage baseplate assembly protein V [Gammaproteobacteria bacterium]|jgi:phage baseplate assembly protein gpV
MLAPVIPATTFGQTCLAEVTDVADPDGLNRVKVKMLAYDGFDSQESEHWARVATPFAGADRGAFFIPDVGDEVLVSFINGDPRFPVVIGSLWNGNDEAPETLGGSGDSVDRWTIVGKQGTRIAIEEEQGGQPTIKMTTPGGVSAEFTDTGGGKIECVAAGTTITVEPSGVTIDCPATVTVNGSQVNVSAGLVSVDSGMATFSGVVQCSTLITNTVVSSTYTPGAGNVW